MNKKNLKELWNYRKNILRWQNNRQSYCHPSSGLQKVAVCFGTFIKPLARLVGKIAKRYGYRIRYRTRGERKSKHHNLTNDIRTEDALFLSVYGFKS